jgi:hypothetical protein
MDGRRYRWWRPALKNGVRLLEERYVLMQPYSNLVLSFLHLFLIDVLLSVGTRGSQWKRASLADTIASLIQQGHQGWDARAHGGYWTIIRYSGTSAWKDRRSRTPTTALQRHVSRHTTRLDILSLLFGFFICSLGTWASAYVTAEQQRATGCESIGHDLMKTETRGAESTTEGGESLGWEYALGTSTTTEPAEKPLCAASTVILLKSP